MVDCLGPCLYSLIIGLSVGINENPTQTLRLFLAHLGSSLPGNRENNGKSDFLQRGLEAAYQRIERRFPPLPRLSPSAPPHLPSPRLSRTSVPPDSQCPHPCPLPAAAQRHGSGGPRGATVWRQGRAVDVRRCGDDGCERRGHKGVGVRARRMKPCASGEHWEGERIRKMRVKKNG